jgi:hypothetical protein
MNKSIRVGKGNEKFMETIITVLAKAGFRCAPDGGDNNDIIIHSEPAGVDVAGIYNRLSRVISGLEHVKTDLAMARVGETGGEEFQELLDENSARELKEHAKAHERGVPMVCVTSVMDSARLPESLVTSLFDFVIDGDTGARARLENEMSCFLN